MKRVLNLVVTHQPAEQVNRVLAWWRQNAPAAPLLPVITNESLDLTEIDYPHKIRVCDPRLHTVDHARQRQSYTGIFVGAAKWMREHPEYDCVHLTEYDQLPLRADINERQVEWMEAERADVVGFEVLRVDDTNHAHWLFHEQEASFAEFWRSISLREDRRVVLNMFGCGSLWSRQAFEAVAAVPEPFSIYLEIWLPTLAHHLGYRVRCFTGQEASGYVRSPGEHGDYAHKIDIARRNAAWSIHSVKNIPPAALPSSRTESR
jgi:hypothetical protein